MGATTGIEWADATVNIWTGCAKVSPACKHCYAETNSPVRAMAVRIGEALQVEPSADGKRRLKMWGPNGFRYETSNWERELRALNRRERHMREQFGTEHVRRRIFINSLSDTFEDWQGPVYRLDEGKPVVVAQSLGDVRQRFFRVAEECTELDILLLTKRPENVRGMVPTHWVSHSRKKGSCEFLDSNWPSHVWFGTTVEDIAHKTRIDELQNICASTRFLSIEPLLEDLGTLDLTGIHWVIVGGESGAHARPMHPDWVRSIRDQCVAAGVPFFFKQWGEWAPSPEIGLPYHFEDGDHAFRIGKKTAGRLLDERTWEEQPK